MKNLIVLRDFTLTANNVKEGQKLYKVHIRSINQRGEELIASRFLEDLWRITKWHTQDELLMAD